MEFQVVDIPVSAFTPSSPVVDALLKNVGKALALPLNGRDANTYRKTLRASLSNRGVLKTHRFLTRVNGETLIAWLQVKEVPAPVSQKDGV